MWLENSLEVDSESNVEIKRQHHDTVQQNLIAKIKMKLRDKDKRTTNKKTQTNHKACEYSRGFD